jgi:ATP-dependent DNA helicase RecG
MERRGSGLRRIVEETKKLVGFSKEYMPEFESTQSEFRTILKNVNYISGQDSGQDDTIKEILEFCGVARTRNEIQEFCGIKSRDYFRKKILNPLLENGKLKMTLPDKPNSKNQKYIK